MVLMCGGKMSFNTRNVNLKFRNINLIRIVCTEFGSVLGTTDVLKFEVQS